MNEEERGTSPGQGEAASLREKNEEEERPSLLELLGHPRVRHVEAGDYIFQEGDKVENCWYILLGKVSVSFAGEEIYELGAEEVLGAQELLVGQLEYNTCARVVEPCDLIKLNLDGFVAVMSRGGLLAFLSRVATTLEQARLALRDSRHERDELVGRLRLALEQTQNALASEKKRQSKSATHQSLKEELTPSYPDLRDKLREARQSNQALAKLLERRDNELTGFLAEFREIFARHPELQKNRSLCDLFKKIEQAVTRRLNTVVNIT